MWLRAVRCDLFCFAVFLPYFSMLILSLPLSGLGSKSTSVSPAFCVDLLEVESHLWVLCFIFWVFFWADGINKCGWCGGGSFISGCGWGRRVGYYLIVFFICAFVFWCLMSCLFFNWVEHDSYCVCLFVYYLFSLSLMYHCLKSQYLIIILWISLEKGDCFNLNHSLACLPYLI